MEANKVKTVNELLVDALNIDIDDANVNYPMPMVAELPTGNAELRMRLPVIDAYIDDSGLVLVTSSESTLVKIDPCKNGHDYSYAIYPAGKCRRCGRHD